MTKDKKTKILGLSHEELTAFLHDTDGRVSAYVQEALKSGDLDELPLSVFEQSETVTETHEYASDIAISTDRSLGGIYFNVIRKGYGHNDPNWGRFGTSAGARNYGYGYKHATGDLFGFGKNNCHAEVWRPTWIGIGKVTYHTRVELYFDPAHWRPGGVAWWGEAWGWWGIGKESKIAGWGLSVTLS